MCATILAVTVYGKFLQGGWITLAITCGVVGLCVLVRRHYSGVNRVLAASFEGLETIPAQPGNISTALPDPAEPTAVVLVGGYSGFGLHTTLNVFRAFPGHFKGVVFASVGVIDSGGFKGEDSVEQLRQGTGQMLERYVEAARRLGIPAAGRLAVGTDAVDEAEQRCLAIAADYPRSTFFAGQVIFRQETWFRRLLHN